jgi:hypothetical protein
MRWRAWAAGVVLLVQVSAGAGQAASFTAGPDTTVITGPTLPDGTIDYVSAINALWAKGATADNNAVPLLLLATASGRPDWEQIDRVFAALHLPAPAHTTAGAIEPFPSFVRSVGEELPADDGFGEWEVVRGRPWKAAEHPLVAKWLEASGEGFKLLEQAADCSRWDYPFVNKPGTTGWLDAMPVGAHLLLVASDAFAVRAMGRAGAGDFEAARADLRRIRRLARIAAAGTISVDGLAARAAGARALEAIAVLASMPGVTEKQLAELRGDLADPALEIPDDAGSVAEKYLNLDSVMMCIRGDGARLLDPMLLFNKTEVLDTGDLARADWNVVLRDAHRIMTACEAIGALPTYAARKAALEARVPALVKLGVPGPFLFTREDWPFSKELLEKYLRMRPGETVEAFSHRIATLMFDDPAGAEMALRSPERERTYRRLARLAVDLAAYRGAHGAYPESLDALHSGVDVTDSFSGKPFVYRAAKEGYTLRSVGFNGVDDGGKGDDFVVGPRPAGAATAP